MKVKPYHGSFRLTMVFVAFITQLRGSYMRLVRNSSSGLANSVHCFLSLVCEAKTLLVRSEGLIVYHRHAAQIRVSSFTL